MLDVDEIELQERLSRFGDSRVRAREALVQVWKGMKESRLPLAEDPSLIEFLRAVARDVWQDPVIGELYYDDERLERTNQRKAA